MDRPRLLQHRVEIGKHPGEVGAETADDDDDGECDAGGDQRVLDRGGAGRVMGELRKTTLETRLHVILSFSTRAVDHLGGQGTVTAKAYDLINP